MEAKLNLKQTSKRVVSWQSLVLCGTLCAALSAPSLANAWSKIARCDRNQTGVIIDAAGGKQGRLYASYFGSASAPSGQENTGKLFWQKGSNVQTTVRVKCAGHSVTDWSPTQTFSSINANRVPCPGTWANNPITYSQGKIQ